MIALLHPSANALFLGVIVIAALAVWVTINDHRPRRD